MKQQRNRRVKRKTEPVPDANPEPPGKPKRWLVQWRAEPEEVSRVVRHQSEIGARNHAARIAKTLGLSGWDSRVYVWAAELVGIASVEITHDDKWQDGGQNDWEDGGVK